MHHLYSFTGQEDYKEWLDDFYTAAVNVKMLIRENMNPFKNTIMDIQSI